MRLGDRRGAPPPLRLDDNLGTYDVMRDGRSGEGRLQEVPLERIAPSPFQVRLVFSEDEVGKLADSIRATGLIHEPRARPHPSLPGWVELMPGEMRVRALRRLVERGQADGVLGRNREGGWLVPVRLEPTDDEMADAMVFGENFDRTDLSPWEWAVALLRRRGRLRERGGRCGVREVAASLGGRAYQTVGEYLLAGEALTPEVLAGAGVTRDGEPDHERLARLPLAALLRVARVAPEGPTAAALVLLTELRRAGDAVAGAALARRGVRLGAKAPMARAGLQLNIRQPLEHLSARSAAAYLARLGPALPILATRAADLAASGELETVAAALDEASALLRRREHP